MRDPTCVGPMSPRPVSVSSSNEGSQQRTTLTKNVLQGSSVPQSSAAYSGFIFENHFEGIGGFEAPDQDEFDEALASMELEGAGLARDLGVDSGTTQILPVQHHETLAKRARVADVSGFSQKGSVGHSGTPWPSLRPRMTGSPPVPAASAVSASHQRGSAVATPQPLQVAARTIQNTPQTHRAQPSQSPRAWSSGKPRFPVPQRPHCSSSAFHQGPLPSGAPVSSVKSPVSTPRSTSAPCPQPALQTPLVTNHLVQLVTATSRTPQQPSRPSTRPKTRRFPGPAGLLPHQVSDWFSGDTGSQERNSGVVL